MLTFALTATGIAGFLAYWYARWIEPRRIQSHEVSVYLDDLAVAFDGYRIALLSDIHWDPSRESIDWLRDIIRRTHALRPDLVVLCGDIVHYRAENAQGGVEELGGLAARDGVYAVLGNHDFGPRNRPNESVRSELVRAGIPELWNRSVPIERDGSRFWLGGVGDWWRDVSDVYGTFEAAPATEPRVLLAHNPDALYQTDSTRVDLMLSGHTHGGQVRLPFLGAVVTRTRLGAAVSSGLAVHGRTQIYVSRGISTGQTRIRFNCRPEIPLIVLRPKS